MRELFVGAVGLIGVLGIQELENKYFWTLMDPNL